MKKLLLSLGVVLGTSSLFGQVIVSVESPASIANFPEFTSNGDGSSWGLATLVGLTPILDTVIIADDGTAGLNAQGLPNSLHACDSANLNDMTGKIALIYRNTCGFGYKALAAQQRGAVAVIIVNREEAMVNMNGGTEGAACTIPVVFVNKSTGDQIRTTIEGGTPVTVLIGDKTGFYPNDLSIFDNGVLRPNFGTLPSHLADNANPAITFGGRVYNNGSASMTNVTVNVTVTRNGTEIYNQTTSPVATVASGDSVSTITLPTLAAVDYTAQGLYKITYTAASTEADNYPGDNVAVAEFAVTTNTWSLGRSGAGDSILADAYYRPATLPTSLFRTCQVISDANASEFKLTSIRMAGVTKAIADSTAFTYDTPLLVWRLFEWAGTGGNYTLTGNAGGIQTADYTEVASGEITLDAAYPGEEQFDMPITGPAFALTNNQKYFVCFDTPEPRLYIGYTTKDYYDFNQLNDDLVRYPLQSDATWTLNGFGIVPAFSLVDGTLGVTETETVEGSAYPNPAQDIVRFNVAKSGDAVLNVTDMSGRTVATRAINVENGQFIISVADLNNGAYIFNVTFDDNSVSRINVAVAK